MMYQGSKRRIAKHILPIMLEHRKPGQTWVEPFVGGGNLIEMVSNPRLGADLNPWAIQGLISIRDYVEELPKNNNEFSKDDYLRLKESDTYPHKGFAGFSYSFGSKWLDSWAHNKRGDDYVAMAYRSAKKQSPLLQGMDLVVSSYLDLTIPPHSLIYCDPPYSSTTGYKTGKFNHNVFWNWVLEKANQGHTVFVSELTCPLNSAKVLWEKPIKYTLDVKTVTKPKVEKLFLITP